MVAGASAVDSDDITGAAVAVAVVADGGDSVELPSSVSAVVLASVSGLAVVVDKVVDAGVGAGAVAVVVVVVAVEVPGRGQGKQLQLLFHVVATFIVLAGDPVHVGMKMLANHPLVDVRFYARRVCIAQRQRRRFNRRDQIGAYAGPVRSIISVAPDVNVNVVFMFCLGFRPKVKAFWTI